MRVEATELGATADGTRFLARIRTAAEGRFDLWYDLPAAAPPPPPASAGNALLATLLPHAMLRGEPLELPLPVSPRLVKALPALQRFYRRCRRPWRIALQKVAVEAEHGVAPGATAVALFCSGGVDSRYTLLRHRGTVTHLLFVLGFDVPLADASLAATARAGLDALAEREGKVFWQVATNLRETPLASLPWEVGFGGALAGVAHLLSPAFARALLAASFYPGFNPPWGSHPDIDPLWSTEALEFLHDGFEHHRAEKIRALAAHPEMLPGLRVCWRSKDGKANCSRCEKCLRTMAKLLAYGALGACPEFGQLDAAAVAAVEIPRHLLFSWRINLDELERVGGHDALCEAIRVALRRNGGLQERLRLAFRGSRAC